MALSGIIVKQFYWNLNQDKILILIDTTSDKIKITYPKINKSQVMTSIIYIRLYKCVLSSILKLANTDAVSMVGGRATLQAAEV